MKPFHTYVAILFLFSATFVSLAQNIRANKDTGVVDELNLKAWKIRNSNLKLSKSYALNAIIKAKKLNYQRGLSYSYNVLGYYYKVKGSYDSSFNYYQKSLSIRLKIRDTVSIASSYKNVMSIYKLKGNNLKAIETGIIAIALLLPKSYDASALIEKAWIQNSLSASYLKIGNYNKAVSNAQEAKSIFISQNENEGMAAVFITLGNIYERQKDYVKSLTHFQEALKIHLNSNNKRELAKTYNSIGNIYYSIADYHNSLTYYKLSLTLRKENGFDDDIYGSLYNIGNIYESVGKTDSAIQFFKSSLERSIQSGNTEGQYEAHRAIAEILSNEKKHREAIIHLQKAFLLSTTSHALPEKLILLRQLSNTYKGLGTTDSALIYSEQYNQLNDSLNEILRKSIELESTIKNKEYELNLSKEKNRSQMFIIIGMSVAIVFMLIILILVYNSSKSKKSMRKLQDIIKEQELMALDAMLEGQENERKRLARELHDTIGSILTATKYAFKSMENSLEKLLVENSTQYYKINVMLDEAMETVRRISHDMATGIIVEKGIEGALSQLCDRLEASGNIKIVLTIYGFDEKIDPVVELELYRVVQELLTNILKHAHAQNVSIQLTKSNANINLMVEDDGTGFNPYNLKKKEGIGLKNIDERLKKLNGKWNIDSGKGRGTTVVVDVPIS
jgi:two-component system, NarL family, sensor kinase